MLPAPAIDRIRESVEAEMGPRATNLGTALVECDSEFARNGAFNSSRRIVQRGFLACKELTARADIIWSLVQRCRPWFGEPDDTLATSLNQQVRYNITAQATIVLQLSAGARTEPSRQAALIEQPIAECRDQLIRKYSNEVDFYVRTLREPPSPSPGGVVINANVVHAVQTGAHATATIHIHPEGGAALADALRQLRSELPQAAELATEQREQSVEVVDDLIAASTAPKVNALKLTSLFSGLATTVQTVASLQPAWELARRAAQAMGIPIP